MRGGGAHTGLAYCYLKSEPLNEKPPVVALHHPFVHTTKFTVEPNTMVCRQGGAPRGTKEDGGLHNRCSAARSRSMCEHHDRSGLRALWVSVRLLMCDNIILFLEPHTYRRKNKRRIRRPCCARYPRHTQHGNTRTTPATHKRKLKVISHKLKRCTIGLFVKRRRS